MAEMIVVRCIHAYTDPHGQSFAQGQTYAVLEAHAAFLSAGAAGCFVAVPLEEATADGGPRRCGAVRRQTEVELVARDVATAPLDRQVRAPSRRRRGAAAVRHLRSAVAPGGAQ